VAVLTAEPKTEAPALAAPAPVRAGRGWPDLPAVAALMLASFFHFYRLAEEGWGNLYYATSPPASR
jgi:hypothetical protein